MVCLERMDADAAMLDEAFDNEDDDQQQQEQLVVEEEEEVIVVVDSSSATRSLCCSNTIQENNNRKLQYSDKVHINVLDEFRDNNNIVRLPTDLMLRNQYDEEMSQETSILTGIGVGTPDVEHNNNMETTIDNTDTNNTRTNRFLCSLCCWRKQPMSPSDTTPMIQRQTKKPQRALAFASTTPIIIKLLLPIAIIATQCCFYYGQTSDMWKIIQRINYSIHYDVVSTESKLAFDALQLPLHNTYSEDDVKDLRVYTYGLAIHELWKANNMPGAFILSKIAAILLLLFSGIWPHLKLFMLLITWFIGNNPIRRQRILSSLSILGKWSFADVLVVCIMVGVLNISWTFTGAEILQHFKTNLRVLVELYHSQCSATEVCSKALDFSCVKPAKIIRQIKCKTCRITVNNFFDHPESGTFILDGIQLNGGGTGEIYVAGLPGIYAFCIAVISSIVLSLIVDYYDHIDREEQRRLRIISEEQEEAVEQQSRQINTTSNLTEPLLSSSLEDQYQHHQRQLNQLHERDFRSSADILYDQQQYERQDKYQRIVFNSIAYITFGLILMGVVNTTIERKVHGAYFDLLHDVLGVEFDKSYSFIQLALETVRAGGWDLLLFGTFCLFIIIGPVIRCLLCVYAMRQQSSNNSYQTPRTLEDVRRYKKRISIIIDFVGAFCAWEVFIGAIVMVDLLMPSITGTIINDHRCHDILHNDICFEVEFNIHKRNFFICIIFGGMLLLLISQHIRSKHY